MQSEKNEKRQQYISMIICWLIYTSACIGKFSYSANIGLIEKDYHVNHASAGLVMTFFAAAYGAGQFIHGILCVHYPRKQIVPIVLTVVSVINLSVFFGVPFKLIKYLWLLSAVFQSILWPMTLQIISENVGEKLMGKAILLMSTTTSLGTFFVYGISAVFVEINYKLTFLMSAAIMLSLSVIWFLLYKPGHYLKTKEENADNVHHKKMWIYSLFPVVLLAIFSLVTNFLKDGIQTWVPVILKSISVKLPDSFSLLLTLLLPLFGIFGSILAVNANKKIRKSILLVVFFFSFISLFNCAVYFFRNNLFVTVISFGILELLLHGSSNVIVSIFPLVMREKFSSGALSGILNGAAYIGTASSTYILGKIADLSGWSTVLGLMCGIALSCLTLGFIYILLSKLCPRIML